MSDSPYNANREGSADGAYNSGFYGEQTQGDPQTYSSPPSSMDTGQQQQYQTPSYTGVNMEGLVDGGFDSKWVGGPQADPQSDSSQSAVPSFTNIPFKYSEVELGSDHVHESHEERLEEMNQTGRYWTGTADRYNVQYDDLSQQIKVQLRGNEKVGKGSFGKVFKLVCSGIAMVRKQIDQAEAQVGADEVNAIIRLEGHHHIVKIIGTYQKPPNLNLLIFPLADCDFNWFLHECTRVYTMLKYEVDRQGLVLSQEDPNDDPNDEISFDPDNPIVFTVKVRNDVPDWKILKQEVKELPGLMKKVGLSLSPEDFRFQSRSTTRLMGFLRESMGCIAEAIRWMHESKISHQDLKPGNILLRRGVPLLTDFGFASDRRPSQNSQLTATPYYGRTAGYTSPEKERYEAHNPYSDDVYSLGCIYIHFISVVYGGRTRSQCKKVLEEPNRGIRSEGIRRLGQAFIEVQAPVNLLDLVEDMLETNFEHRPDIQAVNDSLRAISDADGSYYGECCRRRKPEHPSGYVAPNQRPAEKQRLSNANEKSSSKNGKEDPSNKKGKEESSGKKGKEKSSSKKGKEKSSSKKGKERARNEDPEDEDFFLEKDEYVPEYQGQETPVAAPWTVVLDERPRTGYQEAGNREVSSKVASTSKQERRRKAR